MALKTTQRVAKITIQLTKEEVDLFAELARAREMAFIEFIKECAVTEASKIKGMLNELDRREPPA